MKLDDDDLVYLIDDCAPGEAAELAYGWGAAAAFGLMGMAEAIRDREAARPKRELDAWYERHIAEVEHQAMRNGGGQ